MLNLAFAMHGLIIVVAGIALGVLAGVLISRSFGHLLNMFLSIFASTLDVGAIHGVKPFLGLGDVAITVAVSFTIACLGVLRPLGLVLKSNPIDALHSPA